MERLSSVNYTELHESLANRLFTIFLTYSRLSVVRNSFEEWSKLLARHHHHTDTAIGNSCLQRQRLAFIASISSIGGGIDLVHGSVDRLRILILEAASKRRPVCRHDDGR